jgi:hypothetical protein
MEEVKSQVLQHIDPGNKIAELEVQFRTITQFIKNTVRDSTRQIQIFQKETEAEIKKFSEKDIEQVKFEPPVYENNEDMLEKIFFD